MDKYENFKSICRIKIPEIIDKINNRNIVIWGASDGGRIVKEVLEEHGINASYYVDKNASEIKEFMGLEVKPIKVINPNNDYVIIGIIAFYYSLEEDLFRYGFTYEDYRYMYDNEDYNKEDIIYKNCKIGRYTYGYESLLKAYPFATTIGRYCSINSTATIWNNHPTEFVTTHPMLYYRMFYSYDKCEKRDEYVNKYGTHNENVDFQNSKLCDNRPVIIGNDVWIGANVIILPGVNIGDGAILAAGAVVTKNVEPYSIVGGVPAKLIRYRFSKEKIESLLNIKWWNWSIEEIEENIELFFQPEKFVDIKRK